MTLKIACAIIFSLLSGMVMMGKNALLITSEPGYGASLAEEGDWAAPEPQAETLPACLGKE